MNRAFGLHGFHAFPDKVRAAINEAGIKLHQAGSSLDFGDGIRPVHNASNANDRNTSFQFGSKSSNNFRGPFRQRSAGQAACFFMPRIGLYPDAGKSRIRSNKTIQSLIQKTRLSSAICSSVTSGATFIKWAHGDPFPQPGWIAPISGKPADGQRVPPPEGRAGLAYWEKRN